MIRSLRLRFFLVVWLLMVVALAGLGWFLGSWTRAELREVTAIATHVDGADLPDRVIDSLSAALARGATADEVDALLAPEAERLSRGGVPMAVLVVDSAGYPRSRPDDVPPDARFLPDPSGMIEIERVEETGSSSRRIRSRSAAVPLRAEPGGAVLGYVFALARSDSLARGAANRGLRAREEIATEDVSRFLDRSRRVVLTSVVLASLIAALAAGLLAGPVVGRAAALASAARRIRVGELDTRVAVRSGDELDDVARAFNEMAADLERARALERQMTVDIAHELRTPLTNVVGLLEALEDGLVAPDAATLGSLRAEADLLRRLVDDLQELNLADAGGLDLEFTALDLADCAERVVHTFRAVHPGLSFVVESPETSVIVRADGRRVGQMLRNLLQNAVTHSSAGDTVRVSVSREGNEGMLAVHDRGPGIPDEDLERVFQRLYRTDASRSRATGGTGLGLAIVHRLAEAQGGSARAAARDGGGASLLVGLPLV